MTHYARVSFPVEWENERVGVCRPNGLKLSYFHEPSSTWPGRVKQRPSFSHHLRIELHSSSPYHRLFGAGSAAAWQDGPSSYEILANQAGCPAGTAIHEYLAFQALISGTSRRWLSILTE